MCTSVYRHAGLPLHLQIVLQQYMRPACLPSFSTQCLCFMWFLEALTGQFWTDLRFSLCVGEMETGFIISSSIIDESDRPETQAHTSTHLRGGWGGWIMNPESGEALEAGLHSLPPSLPLSLSGRADRDRRTGRYQGLGLEFRRDFISLSRKLFSFVSPGIFSVSWCNGGWISGGPGSLVDNLLLSPAQPRSGWVIHTL